jgi:hypothetical protein
MSSEGYIGRASRKSLERIADFAQVGPYERKRTSSWRNPPIDKFPSFLDAGSKTAVVRAVSAFGTDRLLVWSPSGPQAEPHVSIDTAGRVQYRPAQDWCKSKINSILE